MTEEDENDDDVFQHVRVRDLKSGMLINHSPVKGGPSSTYMVIDCKPYSLGMIFVRSSDKGKEKDQSTDMNGDKINSSTSFVIVGCVDEDGKMTGLSFDLSFNPDLTVRVVGEVQ